KRESNVASIQITGHQLRWPAQSSGKMPCKHNDEQLGTSAVHLHIEGILHPAREPLRARQLVQDILYAQEQLCTSSRYIRTPDAFLSACFRSKAPLLQEHFWYTVPWNACIHQMQVSAERVSTVRSEAVDGTVERSGAQVTTINH